MAGRRGARSGRGWDAIPPRPADDSLDSGSPDGDSERGNVPGRRRWGSPGGGGLGDAVTSGGGGRGGGGRGGAGSGGRPPTPARDESELAREICLRHLALRPRTRAELAKALTKAGISAEVTAEVLDRYDEVGIIDDAAFARAWVSSRHHGRGLARRALASELRRHGVDADTVGEALDDIDPETEAATARALVDRKLRTVSGDPQAVFRRLVGMLARKGYPPGVAIGAVKDALAAQSAEAAEFADQLDVDALAEADNGADSG
jgi:regulatory protein